MQQIIQECVLALMLIGYANLAIYLLLLKYTYMRRFRDLFKIQDGLMYMVNMTFFLIIGGYLLLKYCTG